jgi:dTDP-4-dehydrorhamnose reductase
MNTFILGKGFISSHLPYPIISERIPLNKGYINIILDKYKPDVLINCIGKTGRPNIDWCENNKEETALINTALPILLADVCERKSIKLVQISSGCLYFSQSPNTATHTVNKKDANGRRITSSSYDHIYYETEKIIKDLGWKEDDATHPKSYYSKTKYAADLAIGSMKNVVSLRIRMPISTKNDPRNFINKIRNYPKIIDIQNSVTFTDDFVNVIDKVIEKDISGIYNVTNPDTLSAADVIKEYQKYVPEHKFEIINEEELDNLTIAKRSNCILNTEKLNNVGIFLRPSREALKDCMEKYIQNT